MSGFKTLVTCRWLNNTLVQASNNNLKILEASWAPKGTGRESYVTEHIPSARFIDMWLGTKSLPTLSRPFPDLQTFVKQLESEGVTDSSHVVIYDKAGPVMFSPRLWLQCREIGLKNVSVLNGGFLNWKREKFPVATGEAEPIPKGSITVNRRKIFIDFDDMNTILETQKDQQIVDTREPGNFLGELPEPSKYTKGALETAGVKLPETLLKGHFPGASNMPFEKLRDSETGCFKNEDQLRSLFEAAGINLNMPTVGTCYNGMTACMIPLAASALGASPDNYTIYTGSWTEFGQRGSDQLVRKGKASAA